MKILVRGTNWIGDAVMTIPALRELRCVFPDAQITLHTRSWAEGIFRDSDLLDAIIPFDESSSNFRTLLEQSRLLRSKKFDLAVVFPNSYRSAAMVKLAGIPRRFGYAKEGRGMLLTDAIKIPDWKSSRHEVFYYLNLVSEVERRIVGTRRVESTKPGIGLTVAPERVELAKQMLMGHGLEPAKPTVALGPGSTNSMAKRWPIERFAELSDRIQKECGANIVLLGSKQESDVAGQLQAHAMLPVIDMTGKTDLGEASSILKACDAFVSNDMGLAHLAAAVGTQALVIFGPTDPTTTRPFAENARVIREAVECSPCMLRECPIDHRCMTRISVDQVLGYVREALATDAKFDLSK